MELALIILMLVLVFKDAIISSINTNLPKIKTRIAPLIKYLGASAILSATVAALPSLCMVIYMRQEGFFAYELFSKESHAFGVLASNIFVNFLVLSFGFFGSAVLFAVKADRWTRYLLALLNAAFISYFILVAYVSSQWIIVISTIVVTGAIAAYLSYWLANGVEGKADGWYYPLILATLLMISPILLPSPAAELTSSALAQMKVGGMLVEISEPEHVLSKNEDKPVEYWLVLRTSENLYLKTSRSSNLVTVLKADGFVVTPKASSPASPESH